MNDDHTAKTVHRGFTLIELLIVIVIIAILVVLSIMGASRFIERGRKVQVLAQFRSFQIGMTSFEVDYGKPPIPHSKRDGSDMVYGNPGGEYTNQFLISVLAGDDKDYTYGEESFSSKAVNPRGESYVKFPIVLNNKGGVGQGDGKLYDPWGHEIMVAINGFKSATDDNAVLVDFNNGRNDRRLHTYGFAEYTETKPREESFVFWSYGKDGRKGKGVPSSSNVVPLAGSDDVISW